MAANEHKNLSSINRHNPKGFETAINDTVLSKVEEHQQQELMVT